MSFFNKVWRSNFLIKLRSWEYWPFGVVYAPIFIYWIWLSIKARSFFYFTASNPGIENGGMLGESKKKILDLIPKELQPGYILCSPSEDIESILYRINKNNIKYPFICKPDIGERGWMVSKISNKKQLIDYCQKIKVDFLIQGYIDEPLEMGVFYYRYPNSEKGKVSSIVIKEMLTVQGDGNTTLKDLILKSDRAKLQWDILKEKYKTQLNHVLNRGEEMQLVGIGNHCRGAKFLNGNYLINDQLNAVFDKISSNVEGFYFGRYDLRVNSHDDLYQGKLKIMELNGAGSEPAHIYNPKFSLWRAYRVLFHHWKVLYEISVENHKKGVKYLSFSKAWTEYGKIRSYNKV